MTTLLVGADGGIGRAVAARLIARGETIVPLDRTTGINAADFDAVSNYLAGQPPVQNIVHVAGTVNKGTLEEHSMDDWHRILDDNLTSIFVVVKAALPLMKTFGKGAIVVTSSTAGRNGGNFLTGAAYCAAKGGVINFSRYLAGELAHYGIRSNCIAPGLVDTPMLSPLKSEEVQSFVDKTPIPRLIPPDDIAAMVDFLLSDSAASITGATFDINGGRFMA